MYLNVPITSYYKIKNPNLPAGRSTTQFLPFLKHQTPSAVFFVTFFIFFETFRLLVRLKSSSVLEA
jgi:hypothetical protein